MDTKTQSDTSSDASTSPATGHGVIEDHLRTLPSVPGVYRMINTDGDVLYVGKAKNLRKRVTSYTKVDRLGVRIRRMVAQTTAMEFVTTHTEAEALLLEANLIKRLKPRYNILLRDDKSFPSILVTTDHPYPQVLKHRGAQSRKGDYFGPFASAWSVNQTLAVLQRAFLLRTCSDSVFAARTRPCLLHQIKRCSAPCVGRIGETDYAELVAQSSAFLRGDSQRIQRLPMATCPTSSRRMIPRRSAVSSSPTARRRSIMPGVTSKPRASKTRGTSAMRSSRSPAVCSAISHSPSWAGKSP